ncbi:R-spondin-3 isoform X1 [Astyanax mexicanus]|uniref:R-spondin-3 isoform X1 n=1 Tax=Astyanax mexicanus TaxID=7994 RepID=UPI0020CAE33A|nr:R-spondin-3 isoform X1 [Astyanax mexicanus]
MQLQQLISLVLILHWMEDADCQHHASKHRQHKRGSPGCPVGCLTCSVYNGCLTCQPKLFIHLQRDAIRQTGVCLPSCPKGFFGTRSPEKNDCSKCGSECETCFDKNFCTRCKVGSYLHKGKCQASCPDELVPSDAKRECVPRVAACPADCDSCLNSDTCTRCMPGHYLLRGQCYSVCPEEFEPNEQLMECVPSVPCEVGEWSEWGPCLRILKTCLREETRTRKIVQNPSPQGNPCPATSEKRECFTKRKKCGKKDKGSRNRDQKNRNNRKGSAEGSKERKRKREREMGNREEAENRNKTEQRRKRAQSRDPQPV